MENKCLTEQQKVALEKVVNELEMVDKESGDVFETIGLVLADVTDVLEAIDNAETDTDDLSNFYKEKEDAINSITALLSAVNRL